MNSKKVNWLFLTIIMVHFAVIAVLLFAGGAINFSMAANFLVSELIIVLPAVLFAACSGAGFGESLGFHKIKVSSFFMIILFTFLCMPLVTVLNAFSMLFADNAVASMQGDILQLPFPVMLFFIGIYGPFCEEFVFRGVVYRGYKNSGSVFWSILFSSFLFGLMHLNVNQALYAFAIGVMMALLVEATGSLWSSVVCHMVFNSQQVCLMYFYQWIENNTAYGKMLSETSAEMTKGDLLAALGVYLMIAAVMTPLAVCVLAWLAKNHGREEFMRRIWRDRKVKREYMVSIPLIIAIVISFAYMSLEFILY